MEHLNEFLLTNWMMAILWFVLLGMIIYSFLKSTFDISPQQLVQMMSHQGDVVIVDVREDAEYQNGYIKGSVHIPISKLSARLGELEKYKKNNIVLSCRSGSRSGRACGQLKRKGFEKVHNLRGGIVAWENENLPMKKGK